MNQASDIQAAANSEQELEVKTDAVAGHYRSLEYSPTTLVS